MTRWTKSKRIVPRLLVRAVGIFSLNAPVIFVDQSTLEICLYLKYTFKSAHIDVLFRPKYTSYTKLLFRDRNYYEIYDDDGVNSSVLAQINM